MLACALAASIRSDELPQSFKRSPPSGGLRRFPEPRTCQRGGAASSRSSR
jgi:hypothetical protein